MSEPATLYVSCNPKEGPVSRFGVRGVIIGASRSLENPKRIDWRPDEVVEISGAEFTKFEQEYRGALDSKSLIRRTADDFKSWLKLEEQQEAERLKLAGEAAAKAKEEKAKRLAAAAELTKGLAEGLQLHAHLESEKPSKGKPKTKAAPAPAAPTTESENES